jgi:hypothetical protein
MNIEKLAKGEFPLPPEWRRSDLMHWDVYAVTSSGSPSKFYIKSTT